MTNDSKKIDPAVIEAEENLLIDYQFLIHELMTEKNVTRAALASRAGISKARLSQLLSPEANPTVKTMARLLHALGTRAVVSAKEAAKAAAKSIQTAAIQDHEPWELSQPSDTRIKIDKQIAAVMKEAYASNDNYRRQVVYMRSDATVLSLEENAEAA
jgi:transcriptional regulator with XRE-family HTH domain